MAALSEQADPAKLIYVIDDDPGIREALDAILSGKGYEIKVFSHPGEALKEIHKTDVRKPDLMITDYNMPGMTGAELVKEVRAAQPRIPVLMMSGLSTVHDKLNGFNAGADDYIVKPYNSQEMVARVQAHLRLREWRDELENKNATLKKLVDIDDLTGLLNMRSVFDRIDQEISRAQRFDRSVGVVMLDVDNFKTVNDNHDHLFGSYVLSQIGLIIKNVIRQEDFAARYGGDEFLICLTETHPQGAEVFCDRLRVAMSENEFVKGNDRIRLTASFGLSVCRPKLDRIDAQNLVRTADHALFEAKRNGKNQVVVR